MCGPVSPSSTSCNRFIVTSTDEGSGKLFAFFNPTKFLAAAPVPKHIDTINATIPYTVQRVTSDNTREYYSHKMRSFYDLNHIQTYPTTPYNPQENSLTERINRSVFDNARSSLLSTNLPLTSWEYAVADYTEKYNHTPLSVHGKLPESLWTQDPNHVTTFMADKTTVHLIIALAAAHCLHMEHLDISGAYLHEKFEHDAPRICVAATTL